MFRIAPSCGDEGSSDGGCASGSFRPLFLDGSVSRGNSTSSSDSSSSMSSLSVSFPVDAIVFSKNLRIRISADSLTTFPRTYSDHAFPQCTWSATDSTGAFGCSPRKTLLGQLGASPYTSSKVGKPTPRRLRCGTTASPSNKVHGRKNMLQYLLLYVDDLRALGS